MRLGGRYRPAAGLLAILIAVGAGPALAQLSSSLSVDSDYIYRGLSLSRDRPDVRLDLSYDLSGGAYGGLSLIGVRDPSSGNGGGGNIGLSYVGYAGYVWQPAQGPSWEAGISDTHIHNGADYDNTEVYGGLITRAFTARVYYAPHYYGSRMRTLYSELGTSRRLTPNWRVFAHAGALTPLDGWYGRERYDVRAGVAVTVSHYEIEAAWSKAAPVSDYISRRSGDGDALVLSASTFF